MSVIPIKTIDRTGDSFVDSCFHFDLVEHDEVRDWSKIPEAAALAKKGNEAVWAGEVGRPQEAIQSFDELRSRYPDFDFCYFWLGQFYLQLGSYGEAYKAVSDGLRLARSKYSLCEKMASIHLKVGELEEAVRWWLRALVIRVSARKFDVQTLVYLSYVAEALDLDVECRALRKAVYQGSGNEIRLASGAANNLYELTRAWGSPPIKRAITLFVKHYISAEFDRQSEELRGVAPSGVWCKHCSTRFSPEHLGWFEIWKTGGVAVAYECPKCRANQVYYPENDRRQNMDDSTSQDSVAALKHTDYSIRCEAALALGKFKDKRAVEPLISALQDSNEFVRMDAAWALGQIADSRAVEPLLHALGDPHGFVRREAALALGELGDTRAVDRLIAVLEGDQGAAAAKALFKITGKDIVAILSSGRDPKIVYREAIDRKLEGEKSEFSK